MTLLFLTLAALSLAYLVFVVWCLCAAAGDADDDLDAMAWDAAGRVAAERREAERKKVA